ncbi:MAG: hypothetical protein AAFN80_10410 [Pseudomonadota bacterium]
MFNEGMHLKPTRDALCVAKLSIFLMIGASAEAQEGPGVTKNLPQEYHRCDEVCGLNPLHHSETLFLTVLVRA